ncbi:MAG TPA: hypothetical protein VF596_11860 [Pyrinomonadaceae bacterium]|jgi:N-methylhydantoinase A/oxoprolinase/acetone carboxylase beta subunit
MKKEIREKWFSLSETKRFFVAAAVIAVFGVFVWWIVSGLVGLLHDSRYSETQSELKKMEETYKSEAERNLGAATSIHNQTAELESVQLPAIKIRREKAESEAETARLKFEEKRKIYEKNRNRAADVANIGSAAPADRELRAVAARAGINLDDFK